MMSQIYCQWKLAAIMLTKNNAPVAQIEPKWNVEINQLYRRRTGTGVKSYTCGTCGKLFATSRNFSANESIHTGDTQVHEHIINNRVKTHRAMYS